jgi:Zn-dependent alcohol dehydrogenase
VYGWVFVGHQVGASVAAIGAAVLRVKLGDYAIAFYISATMCLVAALAVLRIAKGVNAATLRG